MHRSPLQVSALTVLLAALLLGPTLVHARTQAGTPAAATRYEVTDLGTLGGTYSWAGGINAAGQVVGDSTTAPGQDGPGTHAYLWTDGTMTDLGTLGGEMSTAIDINDAGQIVGFSETAERTQHAFLWSDGTMTDLGTVGGDWSRATDITDTGRVSGTSESADGALHPFVWEDGTMTDLGTLPGFAGGRALRINEEGWVAGFSVDPLATPGAGPPDERHAWLYRDGQLLDLGTLGGPETSALGLNNAGQVVGESQISAASAGAPASPAAGEGETSLPRHAFLWQDGVMTDLNDLVSGESGLVLEAAFAINDAGQIVGGAVAGDEYHAFLLTPVH